MILLQGCEPFGFIAGQGGFHVLMAFNAQPNRDRPRQGQTAAHPASRLAGRVDL